MKKFIVCFKHLIVLIWIFLILLIFKITNNFVFKGGSSILFLVLLISLPTFIYIYSLHLTKLVREKNIQKESFLNLIKEDIETNKFKKHMLDKIIEMGLNYKLNEAINQINVDIYNYEHEILSLSFDINKATLKILSTSIEYLFYYSYKIDEFTKYDLKNFEYKETIILYTMIIERISKLINRKYIYIQSKKRRQLIDLATNEKVFDVVINPKLERYFKKEKKEINL